MVASAKVAKYARRQVDYGKRRRQPGNQELKDANGLGCTGARDGDTSSLLTVLNFCLFFELNDDFRGDFIFVFILDLD